jgi:hypothetical protein
VGAFWSSTSLNTSAAWNAEFSAGVVDFTAITTPQRFRCVRGTPSPIARRFVRSEPVAAEPVVADSVTGLVWQGCAAGLRGADCSTGAATTYTWQNSLAHCQNLTWAGYGDWYLPNVDELDSIVDVRRSFPAVEPSAFPGTPNAAFWSSTSNAASPSFAWLVAFNRGMVFYGGLDKTNPNDVRCVRRGP